MGKKLLVLFCFAQVLVLHIASEAQEWQTLQGKDVTFAYEESMEEEAIRLRERFPLVKAELEKNLGLDMRSRPFVVLVQKDATFELMGGQKFISAFAIPRRDIIVINFASVAGRNVHLLREVFQHELCHLLLHDHISEALLPRWLDEGVCQWASGTFGELVLGKNEREAMREIDLSRHAVPFESLSKEFPNSKRALILAYKQSRSFIEYLSSVYGKDSIPAFLQHLEEGYSIDEASFRSFDKSFGTLEEQWLDHIRSKSLWLVWISQYIVEILFFAGAVLSLVAFVKLRIRKRKYQEEDGENWEESE